MGNYDSWKADDSPDPYNEGGGSQGRIHQERYWWQAFHRANEAGRALEYLAEYEGHSLYVVLVADARRLLEAEAVPVEARK